MRVKELAAVVHVESQQQGCELAFWLPDLVDNALVTLVQHGPVYDPRAENVRQCKASDETARCRVPRKGAGVGRNESRLNEIAVVGLHGDVRLEQTGWRGTVPFAVWVAGPNRPQPLVQAGGIDGKQLPPHRRLQGPKTAFGMREP